MPDNGENNWFSNNWPKLLTLFVILAGIISGYAVLRHTVVQNKDDIEKHDYQLEEVKINQIIFEQEIVVIQEDIEDINESLEEMSEEQQEAHDLLIRVGQELGVE